MSQIFYLYRLKSHKLSAENFTFTADFGLIICEQLNCLGYFAIYQIINQAIRPIIEQ